MSVILAVIVSIAISFTAAAQPDSLIAKAQAEFDNANYPQAIEYLNQALAQYPDNAEVNYYLGFYLHYLCYDSVPLTGYDRTRSDEVLGYLRRAIELDPEMGNAYYFLGAEYGVRARDAMRVGDAKAALNEFKLGKDAGGYPDWLTEYGRNKLRSCEPDAILFVSGDAETNSIEYLQCIEGYRTDVTVLPMALMERPWSLKMFRDGVEGCIRPAPITWSDQQILEMRPYKWKTNKVSVPIPDSVRQAMNIDVDSFEWEIAPNLGNGEELRFLGAGRAALADIIATNGWQRPIYLSMGCQIPDGLESFIQTSGFVRRLMPYDIEADVDIARTEALVLDSTSYVSLPTLTDSDMPRVSYLLQNYRALFLTLAYNYAQSGDVDRAREIFATMKAYLPEDVLPITDHYRRTIEGFERMLGDGK